MPVSMIATLMFSPRKPGWPAHTCGAPMNGTLMALSRLWTATRLTSTTPGSVARAESLSAGTVTLMPLIAFWKVARTVPPLASMALTSTACWAASWLSMPALSAAAIFPSGALLRATATGSPASFRTTVAGCSKRGFTESFTLLSPPVALMRLSARLAAGNWPSWMSSDDESPPNRPDEQAERRTAERTSARFDMSTPVDGRTRRQSIPGPERPSVDRRLQMSIRPRLVRRVHGSPKTKGKSHDQDEQGAVDDPDSARDALPLRRRNEAARPARHARPPVAAARAIPEVHRHRRGPRRYRPHRSRPGAHPNRSHRAGSRWTGDHHAR